MFGTERLSLDALMAAYTGQAGLEFDCVQLAPGHLGYGRKSVAIGEVTIALEHVHKPLRVRMCYPPGIVSVSLLLTAGGSAFWRGHEIERGHALVFGDAENDYILPAGLCSLHFVAPASAFDRLGLPRPRPGLWRTVEAPRRFLKEVGCAALAGRHFMSDTGMELLSSLCDALAGAQGALNFADDSEPVSISGFSGSREQACAPARDNGRNPLDRERMMTRQFRLLLRAERLETDLTARRLASMARDLATSQRSLHRSFKDLAGLGPQSYLRILRLHRFRQGLIAADRDDTVTRLAHDHGFENMGRLSRQYRDWFGELPRETRRRRSAS
jgi:AraC-like DNA-binding protein